MRGLSNTTDDAFRHCLSFPPYARLINLFEVERSEENAFPAVCAAYQILPASLRFSAAFPAVCAAYQSITTESFRVFNLSRRMRGLSITRCETLTHHAPFPPYARLIKIKGILLAPFAIFPAVCAAYQIEANLLGVKVRLSRRMRGLSTCKNRVCDR